jgi:hypothetical protein
MSHCNRLFDPRASVKRHKPTHSHAQLPSWLLTANKMRILAVQIATLELNPCIGRDNGRLKHVILVYDFPSDL